MERCFQQLFIFSVFHPPPCCCFVCPIIDGLTFFIFTHPPHFLLYLHLCFTPSLSCCLSVMWSRTDAGSPNCGTAISALLWLLGSLSETGLSDAPPSPVCLPSKNKYINKRVTGKSGNFSGRAASRNSKFHPKCLYCQNGLLHICTAAQWSIVHLGGGLGLSTDLQKTQALSYRTVWQISAVMLPPFSCVCDGKCCVQILCHHA